MDESSWTERARRALLTWREMPSHLKLSYHNQFRNMPNLDSVEKGKESKMHIPLDLTPKEAIVVLGVYSGFLQQFRGPNCALKMLGLSGVDSKARNSAASGRIGGLNEIYRLAGQPLQSALRAVEEDLLLDEGILTTSVMYTILHQMRFLVGQAKTSQEKSILSTLVKRLGAVCAFAVAFLQGIRRGADTKEKFVESNRLVQENSHALLVEGSMASSNFVNVMFNMSEEERSETEMVLTFIVPSFCGLDGIVSNFELRTSAHDIFESHTDPFSFLSKVLGPMAHPRMASAIKMALAGNPVECGLVDVLFTLQDMERIIRLGPTSNGIWNAVGVICRLHFRGSYISLNEQREDELCRYFDMNQLKRLPAPEIEDNCDYMDEDEQGTADVIKYPYSLSQEKNHHTFIRVMQDMRRPVAVDKLKAMADTARPGFATAAAGIEEMKRRYLMGEVSREEAMYENGDFKDAYALDRGRLGGDACAAVGIEEMKRRYENNEVSREEAMYENGDFKDAYALDRGNAAAVAGKEEMKRRLAIGEVSREEAMYENGDFKDAYALDRGRLGGDACAAVGIEEMKRRYENNEVSREEAMYENGDFKDAYALDRGNASAAAGIELTATRLKEGVLTLKDAIGKKGKLKSAHAVFGGFSSAAKGQEDMERRVEDGEISNEDAMRTDGSGYKCAHARDSVLLLNARLTDPTGGAIFLMSCGFSPRLVALLSATCLAACAKILFEAKMNEARLVSRMAAKEKVDDPKKLCAAHHFVQSVCAACNCACPHGKGFKYMCPQCVKAMNMEMRAACRGT